MLTFGFCAAATGNIFLLEMAIFVLFLIQRSPPTLSKIPALPPAPHPMPPGLYTAQSSMPLKAYVAIMGFTSL